MTIVELEQRVVRLERELELMRERERCREQPNPWLRMQGSLPDDELTTEWREVMEEYRRQQDDEAQSS